MRGYYDAWPVILGFFVALNFLLAFIYLLSNSPADAQQVAPGRLRRLLSLWLAAKERDLETRAKAD